MDKSVAACSMVEWAKDWEGTIGWDLHAVIWKVIPQVTDIEDKQRS